MMKLKLFGNTGLRVSELCLGTMTFGNAWNFGATAEEISKIFDAYVEAGGNFFDTACNYQGGAAETHLGALIEKNRDRFVVASKYSLSTLPGDANGWGNHRKNLRRSLEGSLRRLRTDYIDLYQVHIWDHTTAFEDVMSALDDLVHAGKVLHIAVSDAPAWVVARANTWATVHAKSAFSALQIEYSLLERSVEQELLPMAQSFGLPVLAWSPLAAGVLAGKFHDGAEGSTRREWAGGYLGPRADAIVPVVIAIAKEVGVSASQVALAWLKSKSLQIFPILGARTHAQLVDNLASANVVLSKEQIAMLDTVSAIPPSFPNKMWASQRFVDATLSGGTAALLTGWGRP